LLFGRFGYLISYARSTDVTHLSTRDWRFDLNSRICGRLKGRATGNMAEEANHESWWRMEICNLQQQQEYFIFY